jgi:hypothetical protein
MATVKTKGVTSPLLRRLTSGVVWCTASGRGVVGTRCGGARRDGVVGAAGWLGGEEEQGARAKVGWDEPASWAGLTRPVYWGS